MIQLSKRGGKALCGPNAIKVADYRFAAAAPLSFVCERKNRGKEVFAAFPRDETPLVGTPARERFFLLLLIHLRVSESTPSRCAVRAVCVGSWELCCSLP